jgi:hypothetical protein
VNTSRDEARRLQREAIWKWRWLGLRNSTPGFKGAVVLLLGVAAWVIGRVLSL